MVASLAGVESVVRAPRFTMTQREQTLSGSAIARGCNMTKSKPKAKRASTSESMPKPKSKPKPKPVTVARLKRAIEGRNAHALAALYGEDAVVQVIDRDNPPSKPRNLEGRSAISAYFDDVYGRDITHKIESGVAVGKRLAFTQSCAYPDGTRVFCSAMIELKGGKITRQIVVQAWDGMAEPIADRL